MKTRIVCFVFTFLLELSVLTGIITYCNRIKHSAEKNGNIVVLECTAYDPYHPFKGRYVKLNIVDKESPYAKTHDEYYLNERYANIVDSIRWLEFNDLKPELELYVDNKGRAVQKSLTVLVDGKRMTIEDYCRSQLKD